MFRSSPSVIGPLQRGFDFARQRQRLLDRPLRQQARVHHRVARLGVHQLAAAQPVEQLVAIGRREYFVERVAAMGFAHAGRDDEQMQIVIAEHGHRALAQAAHEAQRLERLRAAIDEIADEPQRVRRRIEAQRVEEPAQLVVAALNVADGVGAHVRRKRQAVSGKPHKPSRRVRTSALDRTRHSSMDFVLIEQRRSNRCAFVIVLGLPLTAHGLRSLA